ncbi:hypothetical protein DHBDCA_p1979 [Dehalobacter sp. DCA]|uniref:Uncharacterized protein n=1 Tax=Dehalobacter restrictus (strain DSM 9455 / PER-K23) TaxID=871738 RepID=A0ABM5P9B3_DEHRP|nr:hypothetical protein DHBDCA_p1979 [Dehalobacter sp. DCA]AHF11210.1 hypothetical protein DEHRE_01580 [Dehalobacter restrictus DSM 9455]
MVMLILYDEDGWNTVFIFLYSLARCKQKIGGDSLLTKIYGLMKKSGLGKFD